MCVLIYRGRYRQLGYGFAARRCCVCYPAVEQKRLHGPFWPQLAKGGGIQKRGQGKYMIQL